MNSIYDRVKPIRNLLSKMNIWENLDVLNNTKRLEKKVLPEVIEFIYLHIYSLHIGTRKVGFNNLKIIG